MPLVKFIDGIILVFEQRDDAILIACHTVLESLVKTKKNIPIKAKTYIFLGSKTPSPNMKFFNKKKRWHIPC